MAEEAPRTPEDRVRAAAAVVARVEGVARWLAWVAIRMACAGGAAGAVLWWFTAGDRVDEWWRGTAASLLVLAVCLAPALWLVNVRMALSGLLELPATLGDVAARRLRRPPPRSKPPAPAGGVLGGVRTAWGILRDYGDVAGSWGVVAQLVAPPFWLLTALALLTVPLLVVVAVVAALVDAA